MAPSSSITAFRDILSSAKNIVILSGAGLSAPSGLATYRGSENALWSNPEVVKYSKHTGFKDDPSGSWQFYHHRRLKALKAKPNSAHLALAALTVPKVASRVIPSASKAPLHVTQNSDELSLRALQKLPEPTATNGQKRLIQIHGSIFRTLCLSCKHERHSYEPVLAASLEGLDARTVVDITVDRLPRCGGDQWAGSNRYGRCGGLLRPDVVWFGEVPPMMGEVAREVTWCDLLIVVGTSALVQPAAGFASQIKSHGGKVAIFNIDRSHNDDQADFLFLGSCDVVLPKVLGLEDDIKDLMP